MTQPNQNTTQWTPELEASLRDMRANGYSFGVMAEELGMTRSTIAGKCKRLGLTLASTETRRCRVAPPKPRIAPTPPPPPVEPLRLLFGDLHDGKCKWVEDDRTFCGHDTERGSYCAYHGQIVYRRAA